jgi:hypothetical protein
VAPDLTHESIPMLSAAGALSCSTRRRCAIAGAAVALIVPPTTLAAQAPARSDSAAVLETVQRLFDGMARRDTTALRALLVPGTQFVAIRTDAADAPPAAQSDTAFLRLIAEGSRGTLLERFWQPIVQIHGPLASVWTPYDFHVDGTRSHCGIDAFTLVRTARGWQIAGIAYTVERRGCVESPLGPPR